MDSVLIYDIESEIGSEGGGEEKCLGEVKKEEKETQISDVPQARIIKVRPEQATKKPQTEHQHENIIFYEDDLSKSSHSIDVDQTNRCLLKNRKESSDDDSSEDEDEVEELVELEEDVEGEEVKEQGRERAFVPQQIRLKNQTVVVRANTDLFIKQIVPANYSVSCVITIERNMLGIASCYRLFLQEPQQFLLSAKKEVFKLSSSFLISRHPNQIHKRTSIYQGRLQANFIGTEFRLFSARDQIESLKLVISYEKNIIGFNGPRNFSVTKLNPSVKPSFKNSLEAVLQRNEKSKLMELETAKPILKKGKFRIDFAGKVKLPSAKNFVLDLVAPKGERKRCLLFGKIAQDKFIMQVQYPLTIIEAFGICLSSLDSKLMVN